jgi:autotransporter-associated beta strand protein
MQVLKSLVALLGKPVFRLILLLCSFVATAQHSNVVISTAANANGSWTNSGGTYTFTPTADNAVINNVTLQSYLQNYSVEIKTSRAAGTQVGSVVFDAGVSANKNSSSGSAFIFTITSGGEVQFNSSLSLRNNFYTYSPGYNVVVNAGGSVRVGGVLDVSGYSNADGYNTFPSPGSVSMVVGGDLVMSGTGQVLSKGINNMYSSMNNANGGVGGLQSYVVSGGIDLQVGSVLNAGGGNGYNTSSYVTTGGTGGSISLSGVNGVMMRGTVQSLGGNGYRGGTGGVLSVSSSSSWVDYSGVLSSQGGNGFNSGYQSGNGGNISISGFGGLSLRGDVNAGVGAIGVSGVGGNISLSDGNGVLTSGGGVNDGLVGGLLKGVNVTKLGVGVLGIGGANAYTGSTTVSGGKIYLLQSESIPNLSALTLSAGTVLDMGGVSESVGSLAGSGQVTSSVSGSVLLTTGSDHTSTSYSGILEDGLGVLRIAKSGSGTWWVSGVNTYSGLTQVLAGVMSIGNSSGLGAVSSGTEVTSGASLELTGGISVGSEPLSLLGIGQGSLGALRNISGVNAYAGQITVGAGVRVNVNGGSLNLTAGSVFTGVNASMLFGGSGILSVGGVVSLGSGGMTHDGTGSVYLLADNVYSGLTQVSGNGTLRVGSSGALGSNSSGVVVSSGSVLELVGGISVLGESLSLAGYGNASLGGFRNVSGNNVWSGTVSLTGNSGIGSAAGKLSLTGSPAIAASSFGVKIYGVVGSSVELVGEALYTGQTELVSGSLLLGADERIANASSVMFNGGDLSTAGYSETLGELSLYAASSISLGAGVHGLRFSGAGVYDFKMLTIKGWQGVYGTPGSSGTAGKVYVGTSAGLNRERLDQMRFYNSTGPATHYCLQLSTGELVAGANISLVTAHSNIRITNNATSNGVWNNVSSVYTFTPTADNANISYTELQSYLQNYSVEIKTSRAAGTQVGSVVFDAGVSANKNSSSGSAFIFTITSGGEVQFNSSLSLRNNFYTYSPGYNVVVNAGGSVRVGGVLDVSGYSNADGYNTFPSPGSVSMVVGGDLVMSGTGQVLSKGINNMYSSMNNANGGVGGLQSYVVSGGIDLQVGSVLNAGGGNGYNTSSYVTTGGTGGSISLSGVNGVMMRGTVQSLGGNGYRGGTGGVLSVSSSSSWVDYSGVLSSQGGNGFNSGYQSGNGGNISISGFGGLSLRGDVNAGVGAIGVSGVGGNISLSDGNGVLTSGGGVNDGLVGGLLKGVNVTKLGVGVLGIGGANAYTGSTTVSAGSIILNVAEAIPATSDLSMAANTVFDLHGFNNTVKSITGVSTSKITNSDVNPVTLSFGAATSTYSGLIEDGVGIVNLQKIGDGTTALTTTANTYTGTTTISGGVLNISHPSSLGSISGATIANGGFLQLNNVTITGEPLTMYSASTGGTLRILAGSSTWIGTINLANASSVYVASGASLSIAPSSGPAIQGTNTNLTLYTLGNLLISGEIATGNATLLKTDAGVLTLNSANSYNGITTLNDGQTIIKNELGLGSNLAGTVLGSTANLTLDGALNVTGESLSMTSNAITANGSLLTKNGASTWSGNMTLTGTSVYWNTESDFTVTGNISNTSTLWTVGRTAASTGNLTIQGIISGTGALEKTGTGTFNLNSANTFSGLTKITAGAIKLGIANAIKITNTLTLNGGELQTNGFDQTLASLNISANSSILLGASTPHAFRVGSLGSFYFRMLKLYGWEGDFSAGTSGTAGQFFIGNSSTLTQDKIDQIRFYNSVPAKFAPLHLSTGEVVPNGGANVITGKANVRISNEPTINGAWTLSGNINTFNPSDDNANINSGDLNLLAGKFASDKSVVINSNLVGASQSGIVLVDDPVNPTFNTTAVRNFTINAGADLQVNQTINLGSPSPSTLDGIGLVLNSTGNINLNASVTTSAANISFAGTPKASGNITMAAAGYVKLASGLSISARGVTNTYPSTAGRGGNAGGISITGTGGLSLLGDVNAAGGGAYSNGSYVGTSMNVQFNTNDANLTVGGVNDGQLGKISGANVTLYGTGKYLFNSTNDYTGTTVVADGSTLRLGAANVIPDVSAVTLLTTANLLELGDYTETVGSIAGAGNIQSYGVSGSVLNTGIDNTTTSYTGVISDGTGSVTVTKQGTGNWTLTKANSYSGLTTISAGTLTMTHAGALGSTLQGTVIANGAELDVQGNLTVGNEALTISGTGISSAGALRLVSGDASWAGPISTAAASRMVIASGTWNQTGDVTLNQTLTTAVQGTSLKFAGILSGAGGITKSDVGFLELSGANAYSGAVTVSAGNLVIKHATALGTNTAGTTISAGANLTLDGGISVLGETLSLSGSSATGNGALRSINGSNTWSGNVTLGNSLVYINAESGLEISGNILNNITSLTVGRTTGTGSANVLLSGIISGTGALEKTGTNELTLQGLNTYSGYTQVNGGTLKLGAANVIPDNIFTLNGGELNVNGFNETLGTFNITANSSIRLGPTTPHVLRVNTLGTFYFRMLYIRGWEGVYNGGTSGTAGQIYIQNSNFLVRDKLDQIRFIDESNSNAKYAPLQLSDGEIIPTGAANVVSGQVNIRISNEPTFNGAWALAGSTNTFTANDDNANINYTELQTNLGTTNVVINSAFANGSQAGAILFDQPIAVTNNNTTVRSFTVTASRDIHVNQSLAIGSTASTTNRAPSVSFTAGQHIRINAALSVSPSAMNTASNSIIGSPSIAMVAGGNIYVASTGSVSTAGGANSSTSSAAFGGVGGALSLQAAGLSIAGNIAAAGGTSAYGTTNTGAGGNVTIQNTTLDFTENSGQTAGIISGASLIKNGVGILQLKGSNTYTAATTLNAGMIILGASESLPNTTAMTIASGATFDMAGWSETLAGLSGAGIIRSSLTGASLLTFGSNNANTSFTGLIEDGAGILSLSKAGTGTFEPTYQNTYSGSTTVAAGTWIASQANAFGSNAGGTSVLSGAVAQLKGPLNFGTENFTLAGTGISSNGALQVQTGNVTIGGTVTVGAVATTIKVESTGLNLNGDVIVPTGALTYLGTGTSQLNIAGNINAAVGQIVNGISETSISGMISGVGSLTKRGLGNITISNSNTFTGAVSIEVGNLSIQHNQALGLGAGSTTIAALSKLILPGGITVASEVLNLTGSASGVATLVSQGGANAWNGTINLSGTTNTILPESDLVIGGNVVNAGTNLNVGLPVSATTLRFNGIISGTGAFDKTGLSTVEFGAQNTYTGYTKVGVGILRLAINESIPNAGLMYLDGGEFQTNGFTETIGTLHVTNHSQITLGSGAHVLTFNAMGDFNFRKLRINGWLGAYGSGTSGTDGQIFWGNSPFLIREKLDQIRFYNAAGPSTHYTTQLASGELVPLADITNVTGQSNIRISDEVRTNGAFVLASGIYTFTPSDDNAIINATELRGLLATNSVVINTASPTGTQYGSVLFDVDMPALGTPTVANTQTVNAGANIWINKNLIYSPAGATGKGSNLIFRAAKNISVLGTLTTNTLSSSSGTTIPAAGDISLEATENLRIVSAISAIGGNNTSSTYGGNGGAILLKGLSGITMLANVSNTGGTSASGGVYNGIPGSVIVQTENTTQTTGGGVNDGQSAGVFNGLHLTKEGAGIFVLKGANTYTGNTTVNAGVLRLGASESITNTSILTVNASGTFEMKDFNETVNNIAGSGIIRNGGVATSLLTVGANNLASTYSGLLENGGGVLALTKNGTGILSLSNANTYSGATLLNAGGILATNNTALGDATGSTTVASGAVLQIQGGIQVAENVTISGTGISSLGALVFKSGDNIWQGNITTGLVATSIRVDAGNFTMQGTTTMGASLTVGGAGTSLTHVGNIVSTGTLTLDGAIAHTYAGQLSGTANVLKSGVGTVIMQGDNSFTGTMTVSAGSLILQHNNALGTVGGSTTVNSGASLVMDGGITIPTESLTLSGALASGTGALRSINGANSWTGAISTGGSSVYMNAESDLTLSSISNSVILTLGSATGAGNIVVSGAISGAGSLEKTGSNRLTLNAANAYTGLTRLTAGTIHLGIAQAIPVASSFYFNGGTLVTNNYSNTLGMLYLTNNSVLDLGTTSAHIIVFSSISQLFDFKRLSIKGWQGDYTNMTPGTMGRVKFTSSVSTYVLDQILFESPTPTYHYANMITDGSFEIVPGANMIVNPTSYSNVILSTATPSNGVWSPLVGGVYTFTPNTDNAILNVTEVQTKLATGDVAVVTSNGSGTQSGAIIVVGALSASNATAAARKLTLTARGTVNVYAGMTLGSTTAAVAYPGIEAYFESLTGDVTVSSAGFITTSAGNLTGNVSASRAGYAGNITLKAVGGIMLNGALTSTGGNNASTFTNSGGGNGGNISLIGPLGITANANITSQAGNNAFASNYANAFPGILTVETDALPDASGQNFGQTSTSLVKAGSFVKNGTGTFLLRNYSYGGFTTGGVANQTPLLSINAGTLKLMTATSIWDYADVSVASGAIWDMGGFSETVGSIAGTGTIRNGSTLTLSYNNPSLTTVFAGTMEGGLALVKNGLTGILELSSANTYTGLTTISQGIIRLKHANGLGATSAGTVVSDGASLQLDGGITSAAEPLTLNGTGGGLGALRNMTGANTYTGAISLGTPAVRVNSDAGVLGISGSVANPIGLTIGGLGDHDVSGAISGTSFVTKDGAGSLLLRGNNSYAGLTTVSVGKVFVESANALGSTGTGTTVTSGASLQLRGGVSVAAEPLTVNGSMVAGDGALASTAGINTWTGPVTLGAAAVLSADADELRISGSINTAGFLLKSGKTSGLGNVKVSGIISGAGMVEKIGDGVLTLSGNNSYTGFTKVTSGRLELGANEVLPNSSAFYFNGGTLSTAGFTETTGVVHISDNSRLLFAPGVHRVTFSLPGTFTAGKLLTVNGWEGDFAIPSGGQRPNVEDSGMIQTSSSRYVTINGVLRSAGGINQYGQINFTGFPGTAGKLFINTRLTLPMLEQIKFVNDADSSLHFSVQLGSNEIVPDYTR